MFTNFISSSGRTEVYKSFLSRFNIYHHWKFRNNFNQQFLWFVKFTFFSFGQFYTGLTTFFISFRDFSLKTVMPKQIVCHNFILHFVASFPVVWVSPLFFHLLEFCFFNHLWRNAKNKLPDKSYLYARKLPKRWLGIDKTFYF